MTVAARIDSPRIQTFCDSSRHNPSRDSMERFVEWLATPLRSEQLQIDRHLHGQVPGAIRMELVARTAGCTLGHELGAHAAGRGIERRLVEIGDSVEDVRGVDELIQRLTLHVLLRRGVGVSKRGYDGR